MDGQLDAAIAQVLLGEVMATLQSFPAGFFHGIPLQEAMELCLISPAPVEVVEVDVAGGGINGHRETPTGELQEQSSNLPLYSRVVPGFGSGSWSRGQAAAIASGSLIRVVMVTMCDIGCLLLGKVGRCKSRGRGEAVEVKLFLI